MMNLVEECIKNQEAVMLPAQISRPAIINQKLWILTLGFGSGAFERFLESNSSPRFGGGEVGNCGSAFGFVEKPAESMTVALANPARAATRCGLCSLSVFLGINRPRIELSAA